MDVDDKEADGEEDLGLGTTRYCAFLFRVQSSTKFAIFGHISNSRRATSRSTTTHIQANSSNKIVSFSIEVVVLIII
jgi:hypothetical protein